jgi:hypothetical protein
MAYLSDIKKDLKVRYSRQYQFDKEGIEETSVIMICNDNILLENGDMIPKWESHRLEII